MGVEENHERIFYDSTIFSGRKAARFIVEAATVDNAQERAIDYCLEHRFIGAVVGRVETVILEEHEQERQRIIAPSNTDIRLRELLQPPNPPMPPEGKYSMPDQWPPPPNVV